MTRIEAAAAAISAAGMRASVWEKFGRHRIYLRAGGRDIKAYFEFDADAANEEATDACDLFEGAALKVYTDIDDHGTAWTINRRKQVMHWIMLDLAEAELIPECCDRWEDVLLGGRQ